MNTTVKEHSNERKPRAHLPDVRTAWISISMEGVSECSDNSTALTLTCKQVLEEMNCLKWDGPKYNLDLSNVRWCLQEGYYFVIDTNIDPRPVKPSCIRVSLPDMGLCDESERWQRVLESDGTALTRRQELAEDISGLRCGIRLFNEISLSERIISDNELHNDGMLDFLVARHSRKNIIMKFLGALNLALWTIKWSPLECLEILVDSVSVSSLSTELEIWEQLYSSLGKIILVSA